ncbi:SET domain-containing protein [Paraburkholderia terrae]|uniref:SET domain-containing protein n=1 Tax=Paraburkholderia terrae TaxID=311230 RepID=UPI00296B284D|nr:SET domain-containing protein-lysine N-methyltransferase [Paraburkholderia terrae]MDW3656569.1 SET domain-containing protein-lysine N-methyltransferase [Paraburkholderia terrae]
MRRIVVHNSPVHGRGVFALVDLQPDTYLLEYKGALVSWKKAQQAYALSGADDGHTFFFALDDTRVIDGARGGNSARWLNHSCAPNCEAEQDVDRVFIRTTRPIGKGAELFIDYQLQVEGRRTAAITRRYACHCRVAGCRGTMLAD